VKHRGLQGDVDGLAAARGTETPLQAAGYDLDKHLGQFLPRCMEVAGIHIKRFVVASECLDDFWLLQPRLPTHHPERKSI
jgi:hypothetical protein